MNPGREAGAAGLGLPRLMYGTAWKDDATEALTTQALVAGLRAIDTANQRKHYFEAGVGAAVAAFQARGEGTRAQLFLQTKFTYARAQDHRLPYERSAAPRDQVKQSFASSLEHLQTDYLDSYVLHGPERAAGLTAADREVWHAMSALSAAGEARLLGISNVSRDQLAGFCALATSGMTRPSIVQNRCYARTGWDRDVRALCRAEGIVYQGFSLLTANPHVLASPAVTRASARRDVSPAAIVFRFALDVGMLPLTGTSSAAHLRDDLAALSLPPLDEAERRAMEDIG
jgi:diketogulonate reductase-like aldo/keto reductase